MNASPTIMTSLLISTYHHDVTSTYLSEGLVPVRELTIETQTLHVLDRVGVPDVVHLRHDVALSAVRVRSKRLDGTLARGQQERSWRKRINFQVF